MQTNADATIYLCKLQNREDVWYRTEIRKIAWSQHYFVIVPNAGLVASNSSMGYTGSMDFSIRIPLKSVTEAAVASGKQYVPPTTWALDSNDPEDTFTFISGMWIAKGIIPTSVTFEEATRDNPDAVEVRSVHYNLDPRLSARMQHWRLMG